MSQSSNTSDSMFWSAAHIIALGTIERLHYNHKRYELSDAQETTDVDTGLLSPEHMVSRTNDVLLNVQAYRNLQQRFDDTEYEGYSSALLLMIQRVNNALYTLHHDLLEFPAGDIIDMIPLIDRELHQWNFENLEVPDSPAADPPSLPSVPEADTSIRQLHSLRRMMMEQLSD